MTGKDDPIKSLKESPDFATFSRGLAELSIDRLSARQVSSLQRVLERFDDKPHFRLALAGNVTLNFLPPHLQVRAAAAGDLVRCHVGDYGQHFQEVLQPEALKKFNPDLLFLALSLTDLEPRQMRDFGALPQAERRQLKERVLDHVREWTRLAVNGVGTSVLVCNFARPSFVAAGVADGRQDYGETEFYLDLNLDLLRMLRGEPRAYLFDLDRVTATVGMRAARDPRMYYIARMHWSEPAMAAIGEELYRHVRAHLGKARKCIVLDLDNTLWGGVVGEEGVMGVRIGEGDPVSEAYRDFQYRVRALKSRGILLAVCSKNNPEDALEVFRQRNMPLKEDDFAALEISWDHKHIALRRIAESLNIGTDSMVFVDDSPAETTLIAQMMPEVKTVRFPSDPSLFGEVIDRLCEFEKVQILADDARKTELYHANRERESARQEIGDLSAYLKSLGMRVHVRAAGDGDLARVHQLFTKTNQFNLTTIRYTMPQVESFHRSPNHDLVIVSAEDRFGELGIIGLYLLVLKKERAVIDSFLLSCRAMGRGIETALMNRVKRRAREKVPGGTIGALFLPTRKNKPAAAFYEQQGLAPAPEQPAEGRAFAMDVDSSRPVDCSWIHEEHDETGPA